MSVAANEIYRFFRHSGYYLKRNVVSAGVLADLRSELEREFDSAVPPIELGQDGRVSKLLSVVTRGPAIYDFAAGMAMVECLRVLLGPNIELLLNRHNHATVNRPAQTKFRLHRDILQWTRNVVTALVYIDDSSVENGCTYVLPGSHYLPFVMMPNNGGTWMDQHEIYSPLLDQAVPIPASAGDVLFIDSFCFHSVGSNASERQRLSLNLAYTSADELLETEPGSRIIIAGQRTYKGNLGYQRPSLVQDVEVP